MRQSQPAMPVGSFEKNHIDCTNIQKGNNNDKQHLSKSENGKGCYVCSASISLMFSAKSIWRRIVSIVNCLWIVEMFPFGSVPTGDAEKRYA